MNNSPDGSTDSKDKKEARTLAIVLLVMTVVLVAAAALMMPLLADMAALHLAPGMGLKDAAIIAFFTTVVMMVVFAVAAGDGFLGEIQFMLVGFLAFFIIIWLLLAWVF